jgi:D-alanyl-D-alanine carboxypeptidase/D-alanyl-D-alanine-endopeptidase (penicillin-binding protein 4)
MCRLPDLFADRPAAPRSAGPAAVAAPGPVVGAVAVRAGARTISFAGLHAVALATLLAAALVVLPRPAQASTLPAEVRTALERAGVPETAVAVALHDAASGRPLFALNAEQPMNPASLQKLLTTTAALERLGPAFTWSTPVWLAGPVRDGVLDGPLHIRGSGDPKLVHERLWLLLRRVQQLGVREIRGDVVLDNAAFAVPDTPPGDFDGEPLRPYNARPAALLLNYRAVLYTFVPDVAAGVARVVVEPPLARSGVDRTVPLAPGPCGDWRAALQASFGVVAEAGGAGATRTRFAGSYATACGENTWPVADAQPASYDARIVEGLWREMGGTLTGRVREGRAPDSAATFEQRSPPLAEVVREINKFSNNVMAEQVLLTLAAQARPGQAATPDAAREELRRWLVERLGAAEVGRDVVIHNGSGLSRDNRLSARLLARLLAAVFASPVMPELAASLPVAGSDGTLRRLRAGAGRAHLKSGSLRDVAGLAGYVLPAQGAAAGRRLVFVALIQHPNANAARPALDALLQAVVAGALPAPERPERPDRSERPDRPDRPARTGAAP